MKSSPLENFLGHTLPFLLLLQLKGVRVGEHGTGAVQVVTGVHHLLVSGQIAGKAIILFMRQNVNPLKYATDLPVDLVDISDHGEAEHKIPVVNPLLDLHCRVFLLFWSEDPLFPSSIAYR